MRKRQELEAEHAAFEAMLAEFQANMAILDSGTTLNLNKQSNGLQLTGPSAIDIAVTMGKTSTTTHTALLPMSQLRMAARTTHILPTLTLTSLMSMKALADNGYVTIFHPRYKGVTVYDANDVLISAQQEALLRGYRDQHGLWRIPLVDKTQNVNTQTIALNRPAPTTIVNNVYEWPSTGKVVVFHHASLGFPTKTTLLSATQNNFLASFPGLTTDSVNKFYPKTDETPKDHMQQSKQRVRSTKVVEEQADYKAPIGVKQRDVYLHVFDATKRSMYTNQPSRFPVILWRRHQYVMVAVEMDGNYIDAECMKNWTTKELVDAYHKIFNQWKATGIVSPNWHVLDNEAPANFKQAIHDNKCTVE